MRSGLVNVCFHNPRARRLRGDLSVHLPNPSIRLHVEMGASIMQTWRHWLVGVAIAVRMLTSLCRRPTFEARVAPAVKRRRAAVDDARRLQLPPTAVAQAASLWRFGAMGGCTVAAIWGDRPVSAIFSAVICMDGPMTLKRTHYKALSGPVHLRADLVQAAALQPGRTAKVRLVKSAAFKAKRALYGGVELRAAA